MSGNLVFVRLPFLTAVRQDAFQPCVAVQYVELCAQVIHPFFKFRPSGFILQPTDGKGQTQIAEEIVLELACRRCGQSGAMVVRGIIAFSFRTDTCGTRKPLPPTLPPWQNWQAVLPKPVFPPKTTSLPDTPIRNLPCCHPSSRTYGVRSLRFPYPPMPANQAKNT